MSWLFPSVPPEAQIFFFSDHLLPSISLFLVPILISITISIMHLSHILLETGDEVTSIFDLSDMVVFIYLCSCFTHQMMTRFDFLLTNTSQGS